jgi:hypothetical protein
VDLPAGAALVAFAISYTAPCTIADDQGGSYDEATSSPVTDSASARYQAWAANNVAGGDTAVTITPSSSSYLTLILIPVTGQATSGLLKDDDSASGSGGGPFEVGSVTIAVRCLLLAFIGNVFGGTGYTPGSGWTEIVDDRPETFQGFSVERRTEDAGTFTGTFAAAPANDFAGLVIALAEATGGAPVLSRARFGPLLGCS